MRCKRLLFKLPNQHPYLSIILLFVFVALISYNYNLLSNTSPFQATLYKPEIENCDIGAEKTSKVLSHGSEVSTILRKLKITHFLCYGSLWGYLRIGTLLPWEEKMVFCAIQEGNKTDEQYLKGAFAKKDLNIIYVKTLGEYWVSNMAEEEPKYKDLQVQIVLFERDDREQMQDEQPQLRYRSMRRVGWRHKILPPGSLALESFPQSLVESSITMGKMGELRTFPVISDGLELQKYHYIDSWWKVRPPAKCITTNNLSSRTTSTTTSAIQKETR